MAMKIYLFNPETGVYLGEDFADEAPIKQGGYVMPPDATTIAPPAVKRGHILIFNMAEELWEVKDGAQIHRHQSINKAEGGLPDIHPPIS
jgi:hypothetical protein